MDKIKATYTAVVAWVNAHPRSGFFLIGAAFGLIAPHLL